MKTKKFNAGLLILFLSLSLASYLKYRIAETPVESKDPIHSFAL